MYSCSASILRTKAQLKILQYAHQTRTRHLHHPCWLPGMRRMTIKQKGLSYIRATVLGLLHSDLTGTETETHKLKHLLSSVFTIYRGYIDVLDSSCVLQLLESQSHLFMTLIVFIVMKNISPIYPLI